MYHYLQFWVQVGHLYFPVNMHAGPRLHGAGFDTQRGLAAFLWHWAEHRAHHLPFHGKAWGLHIRGGSLVGSTFDRVKLRFISSSAHVEKWGAFIGRQLIHVVTVRVR